MRRFLAGVLALLSCSWAACAAPARVPATAKAQASTPARFASPFGYEWFVRAELLRARGQHAAAVEAYQTALAGEEDALVLARLAEALDLQGDREGAERALRAALDLDPSSEAGWLAAARIARRHGESPRALHAYEQAEAAAPGAATAALELAELLSVMGAPERALAVLERLAARNDPRSRTALHARLELARVRGDGAALERAAAAFLDRGQRDAPLLVRTATDLLAARRPVLAARLLGVIGARERDAGLRLQVALALGDHDAAELLLAQTAPNLLGGPLAVASAYLELGKADAALLVLEERERARDDDAHARALLQAEALVDLGRPGEAARLLGTIPQGSAHRARAVALLELALETAGLPELADQIAGRSR